MPDPNSELTTEQNPGDAPVIQPGGDGLRFRAPLFGGILSGTGRELSPRTYLGNADYVFSNGDLLGARLTLGTAPGLSIGEYGLNGQFGLQGGHTFKFDAQALPPSDTLKFNGGVQFANGDQLSADWMHTLNGQRYGADSSFKLGKDGSGIANFRVDEPAGSANFDAKLKFNPDFSLDADWSRTAAGQIYGVDSSFKLIKDGSGIANFRIDEPAGSANFDTKLKFNPDFSLNADWSRTAAGQIYGADSSFKLGKDGSGTANFRVDEPAGTANFDTKLKFNPDFSLDAGWSKTAAGQIYGADSSFKLGRDGSGSASFLIDEPNGISTFNSRLKFDENFRLNADLTNTKDGGIYGVDTAFKLGKLGSGTAAFRVDEPANTLSGKASLRFGSGDLLDFDLAKTPNGNIYGADGALSSASTVGSLEVSGSMSRVGVRLTGSARASRTATRSMRS